MNRENGHTTQELNQRPMYIYKLNISAHAITIIPQCRWENGSLHDPPTRTSFGYPDIIITSKESHHGEDFGWESKSSIL